MSGENILEVRDLEVDFKVKGGAKFRAVKGVSFDVRAGETFGLVGESGSGKTTIGRAVVRVAPVSGGEIRFKGERIDGKLSREADKALTGKIQMIFQDPMASLNERAKVDYIVAEGLYSSRKDLGPEERAVRVAKALREVGLLPEFASRFPHEFSGGQRQRIGIARALVMEPELVVADEPISALDVSIRAQVLNLLADLRRAKGLSYLFIAHDLSVVRFVTDRTAVIRAGELVELAETEALFETPLHPYTRALLSAVPEPDPFSERNKKIEVYDPAAHEYGTDKPRWTELVPGRWVLANEREADACRRRLGL